MDRIPVSSSSIASVGYDTESQILEVEFLHGGIYQYVNVPQSIFDEFMGTSSKGAYFTENVRNVYPTTKVG